MMNPLRFLLLAVCLALAVHQASANDDDWRMINAKFQIPKEEMADVRAAALDGSGDAALCLHKHYSMLALDEAQALYWAQISAENGNPQGQHAYGFMLL